jgi:hypothetical protein
MYIGGVTRIVHRKFLRNPMESDSLKETPGYCDIYALLGNEIKISITMSIGK